MPTADTRITDWTKEDCSSTTTTTITAVVSITVAAADSRFNSLHIDDVRSHHFSGEGGRQNLSTCHLVCRCRHCNSTEACETESRVPRDRSTEDGSRFASTQTTAQTVDCRPLCHRHRHRHRRSER